MKYLKYPVMTLASLVLTALPALASQSLPIVLDLNAIADNVGTFSNAAVFGMILGSLQFYYFSQKYEKSLIHLAFLLAANQIVHIGAMLWFNESDWWRMTFSMNCLLLTFIGLLIFIERKNLFFNNNNDAE